MANAVVQQRVRPGLAVQQVCPSAFPSAFCPSPSPFCPSPLALFLPMQSEGMLHAFIIARASRRRQRVDWSHISKPLSPPLKAQSHLSIRPHVPHQPPSPLSPRSTPTQTLNTEPKAKSDARRIVRQVQLRLAARGPVHCKMRAAPIFKSIAACMLLTCAPSPCRPLDLNPSTSSPNQTSPFKGQSPTSPSASARTVI